MRNNSHELRFGKVKNKNYVFSFCIALTFFKKEDKLHLSITFKHA